MATDLHPYLVDVLLIGWTATLPRGVSCVDALPREVRDQVAQLYHGGPPAVARLWRTHEASLRAEAERRGLSGKVGAARGFFGEVCAGMGVDR